MKILLRSGATDSPETTTIDTEHAVIIDEAYLGPIFRNGDVCLSVFARDDGFEMNLWCGEAAPNTPLLADSWRFAVDERGMRTLSSPYDENP